MSTTHQYSSHLGERRWRVLVTIVVAFVIGGGISLLVERAILPLWFESTWLSAAGEWLARVSHSPGLGNRLPAWITALALGVATGLLTRKHTLWWAIPMSIGFVAVPHLRLVLLQAPVVLSTFFLELVAVPLLAGGASLAARSRREQC
jgi:hypothetical protein